MHNNTIDFVVPWVDPTDPIWQKELRKYQEVAGMHTDISDNRYRDWGLFKYWFRGVEKYAPWVNKVHLITCGHYPNWLNINHPKLNFVKHEDYIPREFLPTFSVNPIELNLHRIQDLSEYFVYFNDDIYIKSPLDKEWFFKDSVPCDAAIMNVLSGVGFSRLLINSNDIINKYYNKSTTIKQKPLNWLNYRYGPQLIRTFLLFPWRDFTGFYDFHLANAFLKSTLEVVWTKEENRLLETSASKFRHNLDLNQSVFRNWQLVSNNFKPIPKHKLGDYYDLGVDSNETIIKSLKSCAKPLICINDGASESTDIERVMTELKNAFEEVFPEKSSFEL